VSVNRLVTGLDTTTSIVYAAAANTAYSTAVNLPAASYLITCVSTTNTTIALIGEGGTVVASGVTSSGSLVLAPAANVRQINYFTNTGSNIAVIIALQGRPFTTAVTGTLDTLTTTQTYTQTGYGRVCVVGGGGGGGGVVAGTTIPSSGGASGGVNVPALPLILTGSISVVIGAAGAGVSGGNATSGGTTSFGATTATGGGGGFLGISGTGPPFTPRPTAGSPNGGTGDTVDAGGAPSGTGLPVVSGTTGGGAYGFTAAWGTGGGNNGSGIGTGGAGGAQATAGGNATGYGAGGGGAGSGTPTASRAGGSGTPGVVYVLRWSI